MASVQFHNPEESLETDFLDSSLSVWKGTGVTCYDSDDFLPVHLDLHTASSIGCSEAVHAIIRTDHSALDHVNKGFWTALMYASYIGHDSVVCQLLEAGASVNIANDKGQTPLSLAAMCGNDLVAQHLVQKGAGIEVRDKKGWTALFHATYSGHQNMVKFLLENGANINVVEPVHGMTALMEAAAAGHEITVQYLLQHSADVLIKSRCGDTALSLAKFNGHTKIAGMLIHFMATLKYKQQKPVDIAQGPMAFARMMKQSTQKHLPRTEMWPVTIATSASSTTSNEAVTCAAADTLAAFTTEPETEEEKEEEEEDGFSQIGALTIKTSFGSDEGGLLSALGIKAVDQHQDSMPQQLQPTHQQCLATVTQATSVTASAALPTVGAITGTANHTTGSGDAYSDAAGTNVESFLLELGLTKYVTVFEEQDVDFPMFLTLTDDDLKEIGIKLFGPRRKMTTAIARWNSVSQTKQHYVPTQSALHVVSGDELELERVKSQLQQERQLRAVTEVCLMEDRICWQQVASVAAETLQTCSAVQRGLADISVSCDELSRRLTVDSTGNWNSLPCNEALDSHQIDVSCLNSLQLVSRIGDTGSDLGQSILCISNGLEKLLKHTSTLK